MNFIENFLGYVTDRSKRLSTRAIIIILSFLAILFIDNILGFSHYYNKQSQLKQLQDISILLKDTTLNPEVKSNLIKLQNETLERKNIIDQTLFFIEHISWSGSGNKEIVSEEEGSTFWLIISSSGFYILAFLLMVFVLIFADKKTPILNLIAVIIFLIIMFGIISVFNFWLFNLILPDKLFGSWNWNYVFNFLLQIICSGLALLFSKLFSKIKKNASS